MCSTLHHCNPQLGSPGEVLKSVEITSISPVHSVGSAPVFSAVEAEVNVIPRGYKLIPASSCRTKQRGWKRKESWDEGLELETPRAVWLESKMNKMVRGHIQHDDWFSPLSPIQQQVGISEAVLQQWSLQLLSIPSRCLRTSPTATRCCTQQAKSPPASSVPLSCIGLQMAQVQQHSSAEVVEQAEEERKFRLFVYKM